MRQQQLKAPYFKTTRRSSSDTISLRISVLSRQCGKCRACDSAFMTKSRSFDARATADPAPDILRDPRPQQIMIGTWQAADAAAKDYQFRIDAVCQLSDRGAEQAGGFGQDGKRPGIAYLGSGKDRPGIAIGIAKLPREACARRDVFEHSGSAIQPGGRGKNKSGTMRTGIRNAADHQG